MLTQEDRGHLKRKGISEEKFNRQIENFKAGFPFLKIKDAATVGNGIIRLSESSVEEYIAAAESYNGNVCKFVPASGAASRMFKDLFEALGNLKKGEPVKGGGVAEKFLDNILKFPFFSSENILNFTLSDKGLNYGSTPKGLIEFHKYEDGNRTPFEEHLVEGALYARNSKGVVNMSVTVSPEHMEGFKALYEKVKGKYESRYNCKYNVSFTTQSPATDIVAVDEKNNLFRTESGELLFRPAGHGALLENLAAIKEDIAVLKNIDNVVQERLVGETVKWKKVLIGALVRLQREAFALVEKLGSTAEPSDDLLAEAARFLRENFSIEIPELPKDKLYALLLKKLNRPIRVCGMVKNEGEPGGGPYIIEENDGTTSLQILEGAQIDMNNPAAAGALKRATHFNPVDLVCSLKNHKGEKFNLMEYTDPSTGFISKKSYQGRELKAQELPGLWNGSMSNWNTQFIEVPLITFNPVKTVADLLREVHQYQ